MNRAEVGGRYIRTGSWLLFLGFLMTVATVLYYAMGAEYSTGDSFMSNLTLWRAYPWMLCTAMVLGGALCVIVIGAAHLALGAYAGAVEGHGASRIALWMCTISLVVIAITGGVSYLAVDVVWPTLSFTPVIEGDNVWPVLQLAWVGVFAIGAAINFADILRASRGLAAVPIR